MEKNLLQIMLNITGNPGKYNDGGELASLASLLRLPFLRKSKLVAREQGRYAEKASAGKEIHPEITPRFRKVRRAYRALPNSEFGMWNSEFLLPFFHSAFRTLHSAFQLPARTKK